ncbi:MAG TPA: molybdate ABC transporter substrate-binding protein [Bacillota bacterium]|nr:molybdate ABC transporter substrate-binding protein [Bacillota bacterium]
MLKRHLLLYTIFIITVFLTSCVHEENNPNQVNLTVSAAISLSDVLMELKTLYEETNDNVEITYNFGGSGTLSQQIQQGAPVDIFISANEQWMETLQSEQLILEDSLTTVAMNELVLIGEMSAQQRGLSIDDYLTEGEPAIAIGHPETVPAGIYTKQALDELNLYDLFNDELIFAKDVRQVLTYVETGNADYGFVYKSDAHTSEQSEILAIVDPNLHDSITYPGAVLANTAVENDARDFLSFLTSETALNIFETYGFIKQ